MEYTDTDPLRSEISGILMKHFSFPYNKISYFYDFFSTRNAHTLQQRIMSLYNVSPPLDKISEYMITVFMTFPKSSLDEANEEVLMLAQRDLKAFVVFNDFYEQLVTDIEHNTFIKPLPNPVLLSKHQELEMSKVLFIV
jgi:hypothetical protein